MNHSACALSAEPTPPGNGQHRGNLQLPHTAQAGRTLNGSERRKSSRVMTIRLDPDKDQWQLLRKRASEAAAYSNKHMQAYLAQALKWRVPDDAEKDSLTKHIRQTERGDISSNVYSACENEVKKDWTRSCRAIMAGAAMPQYRQKDSLGIATISGAAGIRIRAEGHDRFVADLHISAQHYQGGGWITVPVAARTVRDEYRWPKLLELSRGDLSVTMARIVFLLHSGKTLLQITYPTDYSVPAVGERTATLSEFEDGRLLLRTETGTLDFSSRLHTLRALKQNWDGIRRRFGRRASRRKGSARRLADHLSSFGFTRKCSTELHRWSAEMVAWAVTQGCGSFVVAHLTGGDWPAHELAEKLKYKCEQAGMAYSAAALKQGPTERAAEAAVKKAQHKARKLGDALRELNHQIGASNG